VGTWKVPSPGFQPLFPQVRTSILRWSRRWVLFHFEHAAQVHQHRSGLDKSACRKVGFGPILSYRCAKEQKTVPAQKAIPATVPLTDAQQKIEVRNNAASLLADLLGSEKNLSKFLIIKRNSAELGRLAKAISKTADDGGDQLEKMAKRDKTLDLQAIKLPSGEKAAREAISKTWEHELLFSSGSKFELTLLLTQTQALNYGSHLAQIAAENSPPDQAPEFHSLDVALDKLYKQVVAKLRTTTR
jgi:hypothetical protein